MFKGISKKRMFHKSRFWNIGFSVYDFFSHKHDFENTSGLKLAYVFTIIRVCGFEISFKGVCINILDEHKSAFHLSSCDIGGFTRKKKFGKLLISF